MSKVKTFMPMCYGKSLFVEMVVCDSDNGDWVAFDDWIELEAEVERLKAEVELLRAGKGGE